ncbi:MAG TPA: hypothetical protein VKU02_15750 [Gemmataceae bacterium]|nr:hypothetical protein [Gemmataceae bacterium]
MERDFSAAVPLPVAQQHILWISSLHGLMQGFICCHANQFQVICKRADQCIVYGAVMLHGNAECRAEQAECGFNLYGTAQESI